MNIKYSEIFGKTIQGEGKYNGIPTNWCRFYSCNLECGGFGQQYPTDPSTYILPYKEFDINSISKIEDLPVWEYGCDSSYSWAKEYRHLAKTGTPETIVDELEALNVSDFNPEGLWHNPFTGNPIHMAFTGGEPMMNQEGIVAIMNEMIDRGNYPEKVTIETNGTKAIKDCLESFINVAKREHGIEFFFSISPKLFHVSGEKPEKAWKPENIVDLSFVAPAQVKFVVVDTLGAVNELVERTKELRLMTEGLHVQNIEYWVMPVGATDKGQEQHSPEFIQSLIQMGFNIADRTHIRLFGNQIGT